MIYRALGQSGIHISAIGLGTWAIGGTFWGGNEESDSIAALQRGLDDGINLIDTAPAYGYGLSEEVVGKAIKGRDRAKIVIATKVGLVWHTDQGEYFFEIGGQKVHRYLHPASIRYEVEQSLRRLGTDYIDLYQTHWQETTTPIADTMGELLRLKEEGKIRAIGVSNANITQMREYLAVGPLDANQPLYNMLDRDLEQENLPFCREHHISILSYSSLALGLLTGTADPARTFNEGDQRARSKRFTPKSIAAVNAMLARFAPLRETYSLNQTQLTIAWTISRPGVTCALVGVRNARQAADIALGGKVELTTDELAEMDRIIADTSLM